MLFDGVLYPLGGYEVMWQVHFAAVAGIVGFVLARLALVTIAPRTLLAMITERPIGEAE